MSAIDNLLSGDSMGDLGRKAKAKRIFQYSLLRPGQKYLVSMRDHLDEQTKRDIETNAARFIEKDFYLRTKLATGTNQELVFASESELVGVRNVDKAVLSSTTPCVITALKLSYAYHATSAEPAEQQYTNAMDAETGGTTPLVIPAALLNGEVEFSQDGKPFFKCPVKRFFREALSVGSAVEGIYDVVRIKPQLVKKGAPVQVEIRYAKNLAGSAIALPANNHFIEVRWFVDTVAQK